MPEHVLDGLLDEHGFLLWRAPLDQRAHPLGVLRARHESHQEEGQHHTPRKEVFPPIAASVLRGLSFLDPAGTVALATEALTGEDSTIRLIAAWACVTGGMLWSDELRETALAWTADGALMKGFLWSFSSGHPFSDLNAATRLRGLTGDEEPLFAAVESGLTQTGFNLCDAAEAARTLPRTGRLISALTAALDATASQARPDNQTRIKLALAELRTDARRPRAAGAARAAAVLGPTARPLIPAILPLLDSPTASPAVQVLGGNALLSRFDGGA